ncbi:MAG: hypothetical protein AAGH73_00100 [Pseudomonadota bacterium]
MAMLPDFAVHFSVDGIALDQRMPRGWARLGEVRFSSDAFVSELAALTGKARKAAEARGQTFASKLVLPNDQLKLLTLRDGDPSQTSIERALEGATPYPLSELRFDWRTEGEATRVAAVAQETLDEAEAFATEHALAPMAFVALPEEGWSGTEAFFGATGAAMGAAPSRDPEPYETAAEGAAPEPAAEKAGDDTPSFKTVRHEPPAETGSDPLPLTDALSVSEDTRRDAPSPAAPKIVRPSTNVPEAVAAPRLAAELPAQQPARRDAPKVRKDAGPRAESSAPAGDTLIEDRARPRFLGLLLTILLILALLAVAAFAAVDRTAFARLFERDAPAEAVLPLEPAPEAVVISPARLEAPDVAEVAPDGPSSRPSIDLALIAPPPLAQPDDATELALEVPPEPEEIEREPEPDTAPEPLDGEDLDRFYAETGIFPRSPDPSSAPMATELDAFYITSIDRSISMSDPVALPAISSERDDVRPASQAVPPPPDIRFRIDGRGLVIATEEGAISPQGITIFAGRPPVTAPLRIPGAAENTAEQLALAGLRPRARPDTLAETTERSQFGGRTRDEIATLRPRVRHETAKAEAEIAEPDAPPSDLAVVASLRPEQRPRNIAALVEQARASQPTQVAVAAPAVPRETRPSGTTRASVARAATTDNAINLRRVNLIGVYGTPSNRSALVRLANGRFVKVQVGDRVDGGRVSAIGESALRYVKGGRNITLALPTG